jgi:pyruvate,water dikinase
LLELAKIARADDGVRSYLARSDPDYADYHRTLAGTSFLAAFDEFMAQHARSALFVADPGWPRYAEDPASLLAIVAQMTEVEVWPDRQGEAFAGDRPEAISKRGVQPPGQSERRTPWRAWLADVGIKRLRHVAEMRAKLRAMYGESMSDCRTWDLGLAERWAARGWLVQREDFFWLTMGEVERALMAEAEVGPTLPALIRARRDIYQTYAATEMPYALRESDVTRLVPGRGIVGTALSSVLSGLPVSPGQVQGRVIVLHRPEDAAHMQEGAILVTPSTETAWFPIFPMASGLIVETGGLLSHGSIITREFGLPAVANILHATSRFHDGDLVLLDGSTGLVQILEPA